MSEKPRILFYFLHLLGVGHIYRAQRLIDGFAKQGLAVDVIYGGEKLPHITFHAQSIHYLSPIKAADDAYSFYLDDKGARLDRPYQDQRTAELLNIFSALNPDLILIEAFPFGRRMVRHELKALLDAARKKPHPPLIVSSVRDILQERKKQGRVEETRDWILNAFDHVLVHSDPQIITLDETFPLAGDIAHKLTYTGFVVPPTPQESTAQPYDIITSAGGGAFGGALMQTALQTALMQTAQTSKQQWCLTTGPNLDEQQIQTLRQQAPPHMTVKTRLDNLAAHLMKAKISISQCGYNTAMDVLAAHHKSPCRAVFVPYDTTGQSEQLRRAELLQQAGYAICLPQSQLTPKGLAQAIEQAKALPQQNHKVRFDGVQQSAQTIKRWIENRR